MSDHTRIEWATASWNPVLGCRPAGAGCQNCYAARMATRLAANPKTPWYAGVARGGRWTGKMALCCGWTLPQRWRKPRRIFMGSMSDPALWPDWCLSQALATIGDTHRHRYLTLTKRPRRFGAALRGALTRFDQVNSPPTHLAIGYSAADQGALDAGLADLLAIPAATRFLSLEPLLGPIDLAGATCIDWVVTGGETGPGARECRAEWIAAIAAQCQTAAIPLFVKAVGDAAVPSPLWPDLLAIREFPAALKLPGE